MADRLAALRAEVRRLEQGAVRPAGYIPLGLPALDERLPGGGLARGALHEILPARTEWDDGPAAGFCLALAGRILAAGKGELLWVSQADDLYAPAAAAVGVAPSRLLRVRARGEAELLWAMEEALRCPGLAAVVGELPAVDRIAARRLQLAAETAGRPCLLLYRRRLAPRSNLPSSPAVTRWRVSAQASDPRLPATLVGRSRWWLELLRCRGGQPAALMVEWNDATGALALASGLRDRTSPQDPADRWPIGAVA